jgi:hypothetical protein
MQKTVLLGNRIRHIVKGFVNKSFWRLCEKQGELEIFNFILHEKTDTFKL